MDAAITISGPVLIDADDTTLEQRFVARDSAAFDDVVALYQQRVARLAQRVLGWRNDVDDVVQDVFLTALSKARTFRGECSLWTWLTAITLNKCRSHLRKQAVLRRLSFGFAGEPRTHAPPSDHQATLDETSRCVREAVSCLKDQDREVIVLFYLERRRAAEIGQMLGISGNLVDVRLHRARKRLKAALSTLVEP
jgi:RNA polymerase sigma-70 factor, ECF subfamily